MSLDVSIGRYRANITHNLGKMAEEAGVYYALWRPEELFNEPKGKDIIPLLREGLKKLTSNPEFYKKFNPENGWGSYEGLVRFTTEYLAACETRRNSKIHASR